MRRWTVLKPYLPGPQVLPGIAFALDLIESTGQTGVQEVLLSTVSFRGTAIIREFPQIRSSLSMVFFLQFIAAGAAAFLGAQPLLISGVTGPITVFNKTIYDIFVKNGSGGPDFNYLHFIGWVYLWGAILHWITALFNGERDVPTSVFYFLFTDRNLVW